jgi:periodic tryptophan protein 1
MITATTWVPRGFAAPFPSRYQFDDDEYERISKLANLQLEDAKEDLEEAQAEETGKSSGTSGTAAKKEDEWVGPASYSWPRANYV